MPARVCVFASSSSRTPASFCAAAARLGVLLAQGGHVCINGGGKSGGMGALNAAVAENGGVIEGVIHKRWVVDEVDFAMDTAGAGSRMVVVDGEDLAERKRVLRTEADAIIALPGGPGTWDELFELVALRQLGMSTLPVCLVNIDGYYDGFVQQMRRAELDCVIKVSPAQLLPVFDSADEALAWALAEIAAGPNIELAAAAASARVRYREEAKDAVAQCADTRACGVLLRTLACNLGSASPGTIAVACAIGAIFGFAVSRALA
mmetsp:Transcript_27384/g.73724  ORF Transcript_27384/g.73724 Transcript_27384/m.73724 type:complete len:263 (-) Transcript_27384:100-888(-)